MRWRRRRRCFSGSIRNWDNSFNHPLIETIVVKKAKEIVGSKSKELDKVAAVYDYVVNNFSYDYDKAKTVKSGYVPNPDSILSSKKGICLDYASVMVSMLRSQDVPTKLVVGYAGVSTFL